MESLSSNEVVNSPIPQPARVTPPGLIRDEDEEREKGVKVLAGSTSRIRRQVIRVFGVVNYVLDVLMSGIHKLTDTYPQLYVYIHIYIYIQRVIRVVMVIRASAIRI